MRNYSANLYKKFKTRALNTLNGDDFYEYFMKVVESGVRYYGQKNEALIKVIDEEWVQAIEECIIPIENIIKKPRKFIRREESVVPVELARKVGSDAVKHLATHTHFISRIDKKGDVIPNKILNVYNEESFDIYENRFIITLLNRINQFLDKRYEALFETTGDEFSSVLKIDSSFNDNDEKVEYNLVLKLHQGQGYLDSKNNDPMIYQRIEHMRTRINGFMKSEFCQSLQGCSKVRSPINRTNLIVKEQNFKKCYELWQFMDRYRDVGYTVEIKEYDAEFDEEYLDELNTLTLFNYLVMKNNLDTEHNKPIDVINFKKKRVLKPKFIRNIVEDFVFDYDIPEVELRQIFNEEITRSYSRKGDDEDDIKAAIERALSIETEKKEKERQRDMEKEAKMKALEQEKQKKLMEKQKEKEKLAKQKEKEKQQKTLAKQKEKVKKNTTKKPSK
jgi:exonuclease SbcC